MGRAGTVGLLAFGLVAPGIANASTSGAKWSPDVAVEPFAGDVFQVSGTGDVIPVDPRTTPDATALFNLAGEPIGDTWGQFRAATASSAARIATTASGDATDVRITLSGLFPNGVYSLFYATFGPDSVNPRCPTVDRTIALTARDPEQTPDRSSFVADSSGAASFYARVAGRLLDAQNVTISVVYHFDGQVYGAVPNRGESVQCRSSFGVDAMRQLLIRQK